MKTNMLLFLCLFTITAIFTTCKKDDAKTYSIEGTWTGKFGFDSLTPSTNWSFKIIPGSLMVFAGNTIQDTAMGTWSLTGTTFSGTYTYLLGGTYSVTAAFDNNTGKLTNGTWGVGTASSGGGTWYMDRVN